MCWSCGPTRTLSRRESRRHYIVLIPRHLSYPVPLLSVSPQGFCAPPRNVIFPLATSCRLPIFTEAIIAHRSSDCPFESSVPLVPLFLSVHRPYIGSPRSLLGLVVAAGDDDGDEKLGEERGRRAVETLSFSICLLLHPSRLVFSIDICLDKTESLLHTNASGSDARCLNYSNLRQANESAAQTASRRLSPTSKRKPPTIGVFPARDPSYRLSLSPLSDQNFFSWFALNVFALTILKIYVESVSSEQFINFVVLSSFKAQ